MFKRLFTSFLLIISFIIFTTCKFIGSFTEQINKDNVILTLDNNTLSLEIGQMDIINLVASESQNKISVRWEYDSSLINVVSDNYGAIITALAPGSCNLTARCGSSYTSCKVTIQNATYLPTVANPYVYSSTEFINITPGETQKISASLFGGKLGDTTGFSFTCDKSNVSLYSEGNYCWITGVNEGLCKITINHKSTSFGYSVLVNCSADNSIYPYLSTTQNVITLNTSEITEETLNVTMQNSISDDFASKITYTVVDQNYNEYSIGSSPITITNASGISCKFITQKETVGECYIKVSSTECLYDLYVLVHLVKNANIAYVNPSETYISLDDTTQSINVDLTNYFGNVDSNLFTWSFSENFDYFIDYELCNGNRINTGNVIYLTGKKLGSVKITVSYPECQSRSIIVVVRNLKSEASSANTYITTSQNYIRMTPSSDNATINVSLQNCSEGDIYDLEWNIVNSPKDGHSNVVNWFNGIGKNTHSLARNAVALSYSENAYAIIEPNSCGTAYIDISHPKASYSTRINIVVSEEETAKVAYLSYTQNPIVKIKNGDTEKVKLDFTGYGSAKDINWSINNPSINISPLSESCTIIAPNKGSGLIQSVLTANHEFSNNDKLFNIITYDTEEELIQLSLPSIWTTQTHHSVSLEETCYLELNTQDVSLNDITWSCTSGLNKIISIEDANSNDKLKITALSTGNATVIASCPNCNDVTFYITVKGKDIIDENKDSYISTFQNVVYLQNIGDSKDIQLTLNNIDPSSFSKTVWELANNKDFELIANGDVATVISKTNTTVSSIITISHPSSSNSIKIYLRSGDANNYVTEDICIVETDIDTIELFEEQDDYELYFNLYHLEDSDDSTLPSGFILSDYDSSVIQVTYLQSKNFCNIKPLKNGITTIKIAHPEADIEKEVLVIVKKSEMSDKIAYLSTSQNIITVIEGEYATATVNIENSNVVNVPSKYFNWSVDDISYAGIVNNSGSTAIISGIAPGTTKITVSCPKYTKKSIDIIVIVLSASVVTSKPYIATSTSIVSLNKDEYLNVTAEMLGTSSSNDSMYFRWSTPSNKILINYANNSCQIKALNAGITYITVENTLYQNSYPKRIVVVVKDTAEEKVYIKPSITVLNLSPLTKDAQIITAELMNADVTDNQNLIWFLDDYNIATIETNAGTCKITPTGRSGSTKLHITHAKSSKDCDILILISKYQTFSFESTNAQIACDSVNFFNMNVPAIEEDYTIEYSSENENVCLIQGSNSVAWICGVNSGTTTLHANMVAKDKTIISSCSMTISVDILDITMPIINLGQKIITIESDTNKIFTASLEGSTVSQYDNYKLKWRFKESNSNINNFVSFLDAPATETVYGSECYVTFKPNSETQEYILECIYEEGRLYACSQMYVIVNKKGIMTIELDSYLENLTTQDTQGATITAILNNATINDYNNITWSTTPNYIVNFSKKGKTCQITPIQSGATTLIARLPNGNYATCSVLVKPNAELVLSTTTAHVIPGYTVGIPYTIDPPNASINFANLFTQTSITDSVAYYSYRNDEVNKVIYITGNTPYQQGKAGTLSCILNSSSNGKLDIDVYCQYEVDLTVQDKNGTNLYSIINNCPDTKNTKDLIITYHPKDLDIEFNVNNVSNKIGGPNHSGQQGEDIVSIGNVYEKDVVVNGISKKQITVSLVPHSEGEGEITVTAKLPKEIDANGSYKKTVSLDYKAYYPEYNIVADFSFQNGTFTHFQNNSIYLGDGENTTVNLRIKEENAAGYINGLQSTDDKGGVSYQASDTYIEGKIDSSGKTTRSDVEGSMIQYFNDVQPVDVKYPNIFNATVNNCGVPKKGLMYMYQNKQAENSYVIGHNFDYYKDIIPEEYINKENKKLSSSSYSTYGNAQLYNDYYIVERELMLQNKYYTIKHPSWETYQDNLYKTCSWESSDVDSRETYEKYIKLLDWDWYTHAIRKQTIYLKQNNKKYKYNYVTQNWNNSFNWKNNFFPSLMYIPCNPYIITKDEINNNNFMYMNLGTKGLDVLDYTYCNGWDIINKYKSMDFMLQYKTKIYWNPYIHDYIKPVVNPDASLKATPIQVGKIVISYIDYKGNASNKKNSIPVFLEKRDCKAYSNLYDKVNVNYDTKNYPHYYLKSGKGLIKNSLYSQHYFIIDEVLSDEALYIDVATNSSSIPQRTVNIETSLSNASCYVYVPYYNEQNNIALINSGYTSYTDNIMYNEQKCRRYFFDKNCFSTNGTMSFIMTFSNEYCASCTVVIDGTEIKDCTIKNYDFYCNVYKNNKSSLTLSNTTAKVKQYTPKENDFTKLGNTYMIAFDFIETTINNNDRCKYDNETHTLYVKDAMNFNGIFKFENPKIIDSVYANIENDIFGSIENLKINSDNSISFKYQNYYDVGTIKYKEQKWSIVGTPSGQHIEKTYEQTKTQNNQPPSSDYDILKNQSFTLYDENNNIKYDSNMNELTKVCPGYYVGTITINYLSPKNNGIVMPFNIYIVYDYDTNPIVSNSDYGF